MRIKNKELFTRGILKCLFAVILTIAAIIFAVSGTKDISESIEWSDENGEVITDETNESVEITPNAVN